MKRLLIIRHAKSSWEFPALPDFDRPLNKRGERDLPDMALRLQKTGIKVDQLTSSPAKRAITTAIEHAEILGKKPENIVKEDRLFHASSRTIQQIIAGTSDKINTLAIFGHNPGLTDLINDLGDQELWNLPTCGICGIEFEIDSWQEIRKKKGRQFYYDYPKSTKLNQ